MQREISTEQMLRRHQCIWNHEKPFYDYDDGGLALRTYRAINWTHRARQEPDHFAAFLFFWIAFNSLYDAGGGGRGGEDERRAFFGQLADGDHDGRIREALGLVSPSIRGVVDDERAYDSDGQGVSLKRRNGSPQRFERERLAGQTADALEIAFGPLSNVRNWLVHGGISWGSRIMEDLVRDGARILTWLVPTFIEVMLAEPNRSAWSFPVRTPDRHEELTSPKEFPAPSPQSRSFG